MPAHSDAIGCLRSLCDREDQPWFSLICDLAIQSDGAEPQDERLRQMLAVFLGEESYQPSADTPPLAALGNAVHKDAEPRLRLHSLREFSNFRRLGPTVSLALKHEKALTVVFGTNGSGKSSLCDAIRVLALRDQKADTLPNVRANIDGMPSFTYSVDGGQSHVRWDESHGFGHLADHVRIFDSQLAVRSVDAPTDPTRSVEVSAFRLEVFEFCGDLVKSLKDRVEQERGSVAREAELAVNDLVAACSDLPEDATESLREAARGDCRALREFAATLEAPTEDQLAGQQSALQQIASLERATSEEGAAALEVEADRLRSAGRAASTLVTNCERAVSGDYLGLAAELTELLSRRETLASEVLPPGASVDGFVQFLEAARGVFDYPGRADEPCPFCRQTLSASALQLIAKYQEFPRAAINEAIGQKERSRKEMEQSLQGICDWDLETTKRDSSTLDGTAPEAAMSAASELQRWARRVLGGGETTDCDLAQKLAIVRELGRQLEDAALAREAAIALARDNRAGLAQQLTALRSSVGRLEFTQRLLARRDTLERFLAMALRHEELDRRMREASFSTLLKKLTDLGKRAHSELVCSEFESCLNREYVALSDGGLASRGVSLRVSGSDQAISIAPWIGKAPIARVLSEGERKTHALAPFFCEVTYQRPGILVFDDPTTSLDYNIVSNFAKRLRSLVHQRPELQILVFTHNWDLFVELQVVMNQSGLSNDLDIQVLEHCTSVRAYQEKRKDLHDRIDEALAVPGEPDVSRTEELCSLMRRLVEAVVNELVFNSQRHQYHQKTVGVSSFTMLTQLVRLTPEEAEAFKDLFRELSPSEHDDPRTLYTNVTRERLQAWLDRICRIEDGLEARKAAIQTGAPDT